MDPSCFTKSWQLFSLFRYTQIRQLDPPSHRGGSIDWEGILEPYGFSDYFPGETPNRVLRHVCPRPSICNPWLLRAHYLLQCTRHVNQLIRAFETFFTTLEHEGLRDLVEEVDLNKEIDFLYSPALTFEQATYLMALYDFFLCEHALFIACPILQLLHISLPDTQYLDSVYDHIIDNIEPPLYSYMLLDGEDNDSSSSA